MITQETWYIKQTDNILRERFGTVSAWMRKLDSETKIRNCNHKIEYIEIEEEPEEVKVKEFAYSDVFAYSDINPYKSERIEKRITRELRQIIQNEEIAKENEKTKMFWLFRFLFSKNENKDTEKYYKREERERIIRVRKYNERRAKLIKDQTPLKHYDYTVSTPKLREDRNMGANHNTTKRKLKQIEVMKLQEIARKKAHKILRKLKTMQQKGELTTDYLKSLSIYITDIISDIEPYEAIDILNELQKDAFAMDQRKNIPENESEKLMRYMDYSNRLGCLRENGISYKNLITKEQRELKELIKQKEEK